MKIEEMIKEANKKLRKNQIEDASLIARVLLQFVLKLDRSELLLKQAQEIGQKEEQEYEAWIQKIVEGVPLQYIINKQEFYGLNFYVDENVLIPQPDTEILVEEVLAIASKEKKKKLLDICTGSGAIGIALAYHLPNATITMSDISAKALAIAKKNARENKVIEKVEMLESNLFENIEGKFDLIVSNPPYIETNVIPTLPKQVQREPILALDGGEDGLMFYRKLVEETPKYLEKDGYLCMEIGYNQKNIVIQLLQKNKSYQEIMSKKDLSGNDRIIIAKIGN